MYGKIKNIFCCVLPADDGDDYHFIPPRLNLNCEADRLKTFKKWRNKNVNKNILAKSGFYYLGDGDRVRCQFCCVVLSDWVKGDCEVGEHLKWSPHCTLLRRCKTNNMTIEQTSTLDHLLDKIGVDICNSSRIVVDG